MASLRALIFYSVLCIDLLEKIINTRKPNQYNINILTEMINSGYFTSRNDIIQWVNNLLKVNLTKIQQLGAGNLYCQILDATFPNKVPLQKVKWNAYMETQFLQNFKILQTCFEKLGIKKYVEVQKLVKAKYQDNLEFVQWMKWFFEEKIEANKVYDSLARRHGAQVFLGFCSKKRLDEFLQNKQNRVEKRQKPKLTSSYSSQLSQRKSQSNLLNSTLVFNHQKSQKNLKLSSSVIFSKDTMLSSKKDVKKEQKFTKPNFAKIKAVKIIESDEQQCF